MTTSNSIKVATVLMGRGVNALIGILFVPYLSRALPLADYGTYGQTLMATDFFKFLFAIGLAKIIMVYYANHENEKNQVFGSNLLAAIVSGTLASLLIILLAPFIASSFENPELTHYLKLFGFSILVSIVFDTLNATLIYFDKIKESVYALVLGNVAKIVLLLVAIQVYQSMDYIFYALLIAISFQAILAAFFIPRELFRNISVKSTYFTNQIKEGIPLGLSAIAAILMITVDGFMVSRLLSVEAYAIYRNGSIQIPFLASVYASISMIILPVLARLFSKKENKEIATLKKQVISNTAAILYPPLLFVLFFHQPLIETYLSSKYAESAIVFCVYNLIMLFQIHHFQEIPIIAGKTKFIFLSFAIGFIVNLILNLLLIPRIGILGGAIGTVVATITVMFMLSHKTLNILNIGVTDFFDLRKIFKVFLLTSTLMGLFYLIYPIQYGILPLLFIGGFMVVLCYLLLLKIGILEKRIVEQLLAKIPIIGNRLVGIVNQF